MERPHTEPVHYRMGGKIEFCGVEALGQSNEVTVQIDRIDFYDRYKVQGEYKRNVWIAYFKPNPHTTLPMLLNSTNRKRLAKLAGTEFINTIKDMWVVLTKELCRDPTGEESQIYGLRISKRRAVAPQAAPKKVPLTEMHPNFALCVKHISGGGAIADLEQKYIISEEVGKKLMQMAAQAKEQPEQDGVQDKK